MSLLMSWPRWPWPDNLLCSSTPSSDFPALPWSVLVSVFQLDTWSSFSCLWTYLPSHIPSSLLDLFQEVPKETLKSPRPISCSVKFPQPYLSCLSAPLSPSNNAAPLYHSPLTLLLTSFPRMLSGNNLHCAPWSVGMALEKPPDLCPWLGNFHIMPPLQILLQFVQYYKLSTNVGGEKYRAEKGLDR